MFTLPSLKYTIVFLFLFAVISKSQAQNFSYVYIQGDKKTPFYVKFEDEMLPRYGKNYTIIPMLAPGPINIEILFQQNAYPPQKFVIAVPESGNRSFLLKNNQGAFSLYDFQQKIYLKAGNSIEEDNLPASRGAVYNRPKTINNPVVEKTATAYIQPEKTPSFEASAYTKTKSTQTISPSDEQPKFIANIQINTGNKSNTATTKPRSVATPPQTSTYTKPAATSTSVTNNNKPIVPTTKPKTQTQPVSLYNSDCPTPIDNNTFDNIYDKAVGKTDKIKLKYLLSEVDQCFSTFQAKTLALILPNDPERYTFLKRVYPRVTDQEKFPVLEHILTTNEWKDYFKLIIPQ